MNDTPWESEGPWFTSPWSFLEPAREGLAFPARVRFHHVTLREGEQQAKIAFTREDKLAIARQCVEDDPTELFPYHWDVVGQPLARVVYGKGSGLPSVTLALAALRTSAEDEEMREVLAAIKARALETTALLPFEEVARIVQERLAARATLGAPAT